MFFGNAIFAVLLAVFGATNVLASYQPPAVLVPYGAPALSNAAYVQSLSEAQSSALSSAAGAAAAAAKVDYSKKDLLDRYGYEIGRRPLLTTPVGALTNLYGASLEIGNFVGHVEPGFVIDSNGKIKHLAENRIAAVVL